MESKLDGQFRALAGSQIKDILPQLPEMLREGDLTFAHEETAAECINYYSGMDAVEDGADFYTFDVNSLLALTDVGRADFAELLDARIEDVREVPTGYVAIISGADPQEMERFANAYSDFLDAEELMELTM